MKKNVFLLGLIGGILASTGFIISTIGCYNSGNFEGNMLLGYASMLIGFSFVFVGVKNYRDKYNGGIITFGKAFKVAISIALIASTIYVGIWLIEYYLFIPDFMDKYTAHVISKAQTSGAPAADIAAKIDQIKSMKEMYKSPIIVILLTYMEPVPVGLVISIVTALRLKRKASN